jgi:integrase
MFYMHFRNRVLPNIVLKIALRKGQKSVLPSLTFFTMASFLSPEDIKRILRAIDAHREMRKGSQEPTPEDGWLKEMIRISVGTGLRREKLLNLRWADVDLKSKHLVVRSRKDFTLKSGTERAVPLRADALDTLQEISQARTPLDKEPAFIDSGGNVPRPRRVSERFKFYVSKAGLPDQEDLSLDLCRHTTASWLMAQGAPPQVFLELLGGSSREK